MANDQFDVLYRFKGETGSYYRLVKVCTKKEIEERIKENHYKKYVELQFWNPNKKIFSELNGGDLHKTTGKNGENYVFVEVVASHNGSLTSFNLISRIPTHRYNASWFTCKNFSFIVARRAQKNITWVTKLCSETVKHPFYKKINELICNDFFIYLCTLRQK